MQSERKDGERKKKQNKQTQRDSSVWWWSDSDGSVCGELVSDEWGTNAQLDRIYKPDFIFNELICTQLSVCWMQQWCVHCFGRVGRGELANNVDVGQSWKLPPKSPKVAKHHHLQHDVQGGRRQAQARERKGRQGRQGKWTTIRRKHVTNHTAFKRPTVTCTALLSCTIVAADPHPGSEVALAPPITAK